MENKKTTLKIGGMSCASCAATIEKTLKAVKGVSEAAVNFATEKAVVEHDPSQAKETDLIKAVESAGYSVIAEREKVIFNIGGMTCASCVHTIEKALHKAEGVFGATVNLATEQATIEFDAGVTNLKELEKVIEGTGY
ncbi:hypothetical protein LCGC14_2198810, partial [marine sediment metagenome]